MARLDVPDAFKEGCGKVTAYYLADTHFGHANIIRYEQRPFHDVGEMDETLVRNWNARVGVGDEIWFLGDFSLAGAERTRELVAQLAGVKYLVVGNHDEGRSLTFWRQAGFAEVYTKTVRLSSGLVLSHESELALNADEVNIHGHSHRVREPFCPRRYCVSVENVGYRPVTYKELQKRCRLS